MLQLEQLREDISTATLAATLARAQGADAQIPDAQRIRADFDAALAAPPEHVAHPEQYMLMQALGLR